ncbi:hypothetical protein [Amycolatopsis sp. NPDC051903]|uniref:hypothetical protein n=1 Tax=Amycolatopsis sp. NPDC051903 TaxID=3363936 RepID=UPI00379EF0BC
MTIKEILQVGQEMTGIPEAARCVNNPNWGDCLSTLASLIPVGKIDMATRYTCKTRLFFEMNSMNSSTLKSRGGTSPGLQSIKTETASLSG